MSANSPFEIQEEIIKNFPAKSLIKFRSVSKQWKSLIDSSEFITDHSVNKTLPHHLLIWYTPSLLNSAYGNKYVSIVDDDSFPLHKCSPAISHAIKQVRFPYVIGCSHGLVCLLAASKRMIVFWNPSVRKSVGVVLPNADGVYAFGAGVCPKTFDLKIVKIYKIVKDPHIINAEVYTLRSRVWRNISMNRSPPRGSMQFMDNSVVIDGVVHWVAFNHEFDCHRIVTFDLTSEKFGEVDLPNSLAGRKYLDISKLKESLVVLTYYYLGGPLSDVWMMLKNGDAKSSFTKVSTVKRRYGKSIIGFRKNGNQYMEVEVRVNLKFVNPARTT